MGEKRAGMFFVIACCIKDLFIIKVFTYKAAQFQWLCSFGEDGYVSSAQA